MEDAATAEISRTQLWQWVHHPDGVLTDGRKVDPALFRAVLAEELDRIRDAVGGIAFAAGHYETAARLFDEIVANDSLEEFLTLRAYEYLP
jgi:malate synthase